MSKKPQRSRHRVPAEALAPRSVAVLDERYAAEVERDTARLERRWRQAQKAVAGAIAKRERIAEQDANRAAIQAAEAAVEAAERELHEIERLMQPGNHASARHRGTKSFRKAG